MKKTNTPRNSRNKNVRIDVHYLTRVEGHGDITVDIQGGELKQCRFRVVESPRFFEAMLAGRLIYEAQHLSSRICGICACGHTLASLKASESALGVVPPPAVIPLRKLLLYSEVMDSHLLHFYMLAAPDFLGVPSIMPLVRTKPAVVERAFRMKKLSDWTGEILAGRHTHPITFAIGGVTMVPEKSRLEKLHEAMLAARKTSTPPWNCSIASASPTSSGRRSMWPWPPTTSTHSTKATSTSTIARPWPRPTT